jgi:DivIVA domain-containing protein
MSTMELSPQAVAAATFKTVKRGYDPDEVRAYLVEVSASLESSHQQATAMEARARAAIAKLQDATHHAPSSPAVAPDEAETISRTLLLAQRTADTAIAEALTQAAAVAAKAESDAAAITAKAESEAAAVRAQADGEAAAVRAQADGEAAAVRARAESEAAAVTTVAKNEATAAVEQARAAAAMMLDEARAEARRTKDDEQVRAEQEVHSLLSRREALVSDVDALEHFVAAERERLRAASAALLGFAELAPGGMSAGVRPTLSSVGDALPAPRHDTASSTSDANGDVMPPPVPEPLITGQIPIVGARPLVSPMPSSNEEARSMWHDAELADDAAAASDDTIAFDATPPVGAAVDLRAMAESEGAFDDEATPAEGLRIGGDELG